MKNWLEVGFVLISATAICTSAWAGAGPTGDSHDESFSAGEPGDVKKPARIVRVTTGETDGKMTFTPDKFEVRKDEQIKFVLRNNGELDHEFILATTTDNLKHAEAMRKTWTWNTMIRTARAWRRRRPARSSGNSRSVARSNTPA